MPRLSTGRLGAVLLLLIALPCFLTLPWTLGTPSHSGTGQRYNDQRLKPSSQLQGPGSVSFQADAASPEVTFFEPLGTDDLGRSVFVRCLMGGAISLGVGICAALLAVFIGVSWGAAAGYLGGRADAFMMRIVDVFYGLPYLLLVVMLSVAVGGVVDNLSDGFVTLPGVFRAWWGVSPAVYVLASLGIVLLLCGVVAGLIWVTGEAFKARTGLDLPDLLRFCIRLLAALLIFATLFLALWMVALIPVLHNAKGETQGALPGFLVTFITDYPLVINLLTLVAAIGGVSWLTMARVIRGQVLSLRSQPFIEAARAQGMGVARIIRVHLLPNLIGPIVVYTTLAVPQAILQESFLSFLGIGVQEPLPSWGQLASKGIEELPALAMPGQLAFNWWLIVFPCLLLGLTLMSLNFMGDALRERFDPRSNKKR
jgi:oligopeptide transport system permease protein